MTLPTLRHLCPVDGCAFYLDRPSPLSTPPRGAFLTMGEFVGAVALQEVRDAEAVFQAHVDTHTPLEYLRTIQRLNTELAKSTGATITEHALRLAGGGMQVRNPHPDIERVYPLTEWVKDEQRNGSEVYRRRIVVVEDWAKAEEPRVLPAPPPLPEPPICGAQAGQFYGRCRYMLIPKRHACSLRGEHDVHVCAACGLTWRDLVTTPRKEPVPPR